jgi:hypothetical protein
MKAVTLLLIGFLTTLISNAYCQDQDVEGSRKAILEEGIYLFRLEKASWHATDLLVKNNSKLLEQLAGYLSYIDGSSTRTIFWSDENMILLTVSFDSLAAPDNGIEEDQTRNPTAIEEELILLRSKAYDMLVKNEGEFFSFYENTSPNLIPVIRNNERMTFVLTGSKEKKLVIGNDYKLIFNKDNQIIQKIKLHNTLIPIEQSGHEMKTVGSMHTHILADQPFMTATDICTFLLYKDVFKLTNHVVISDKWTSIFHADKGYLIIVPHTETNSK